jgi:hypothetical protein
MCGMDDVACHTLQSFLLLLMDAYMRYVELPVIESIALAAYACEHCAVDDGSQ